MPSGIGITITTNPPVKEIIGSFQKTSRNTPKFLDRKMKELSLTVWKKIQAEAPYKTGALRKAIVHKKRGLGQYEVFVDRRTKGGKYEPFVRLGVPAASINPILPRKKKALYWPGAAHPVRAVYNHPGIKPNDYWERGLSQAESEMTKTEQAIGSEMEAMI